RARGPRLLPPPGRGSPPGLPRVRARLATQAGALAADRGRDRLFAGRRASGRDRGAAPHAARRLPRAPGRIEHEAADAEAARVHLGRPALLRGRGNAEPARIRSGVLRQGRRRARGPEADRRPVQGPGLCARPRARAPGVGRHALPADRHVQPPADPGGVLLRPPVRADGPPDVGTRQRSRPGGPDLSRRTRGRRGRGRLPRDRANARGHRVPSRARGAGRSRRLTVCGIAGIVRPQGGQPVAEAALLRMARAIRHRGPDGYGLALDAGAGLVSTRLAIVDLPCGWQPLASEDNGDLLVYSVEFYNRIELRDELAARGERFETSSDTEVVLRMLEREGLDALHRL